jgi:multiple sugar transport system permease protein
MTTRGLRRSPVPTPSDGGDPPIVVPYPRMSTAGISRNILLAAFGVVFAAPVLWMALASVDANASWSITIPHLTLSHFRALLNGTDMHPLYNSFFLAGVSPAVTVALGVLAAYALSRRHIPFKATLMLTIVFASGLPVTMLLIPTYQMYVRLGWINSLLSTSLFMAASSIPFAIWLLKNFIDQVPVELEEAAALEGAGTIATLLRIVVPLALPGIAATAIIVFIGGWGAFLIPLILDSDPNHVPGAIAIYQFLGGSYGVVRFGELAAYSLLFSIPVLLLYLLAGRRISGAFHLGGGVKG